MTGDVLSEFYLKIPKSIEPRNVNQFLQAFQSLRSQLPSPIKPVVVDFSEARFFNPVGAVIVASLVDDLQSLGYTVKAIPPVSSHLLRYLRAIGLFKARPTPVGDAQELALGNHAVKLARCTNSDEAQLAIGETVKQVEKRTQCTAQTKAAIDYSLWEIVDNAACHGYGCYHSTVYPMPVYVCAFAYKNRVDITVADRGQGIASSLRKRKQYQQVSNSQALPLALQKGVSGHPEGSPGFGLYSASEFVRINDGRMYIWSSGRQLSFSASGHTVDSSIKWGTIVHLSINAQVNIPFEDIVGRSAQDHLTLFDPDANYVS